MTRRADDALRAAGAVIVRVITIVDRQDSAAEAFAQAGMEFRPLLTLGDFR
jgi:orotate phosphoribosyltransferase